MVAASTPASGKTFAPDGIPPSSGRCTKTCKVRTLLEKGTYPTNKRARQVLIPKDMTIEQTKVYMFETAGKLYEQVLVARIRKGLEAGEDLADTQFGFHPIESALGKLDKIV